MLILPLKPAKAITKIASAFPWCWRMLYKFHYELDGGCSGWKAWLRLQERAGSSHLLHQYATSGHRQSSNPTEMWRQKGEGGRGELEHWGLGPVKWEEKKNFKTHLDTLTCRYVTGRQGWKWYVYVMSYVTIGLSASCGSEVKVELRRETDRERDTDGAGEGADTRPEATRSGFVWITAAPQHEFANETGLVRGRSEGCG